MTLSEKERLILMILIVSEQELGGLEIAESSGNMLKRGLIYLTLSQMEEKGLIKSEFGRGQSDPSLLPRRRYHVTRLGERAYNTTGSQRSILNVLRPA